MQSKLRKAALNIFIALLISVFISLRIYFKNNNINAYYLAIILLIIIFHLGMRLATGPITRFLFNGKPNANFFIFKEQKFEQKLYKFLRVREWKDKIPTHYPDTFDIKKNSEDEIIKTMCESEMIHGMNIIGSIISVIMSIIINPLRNYKYLFILTSFPLIIIESGFCIIQRYNRPRLIKIIKKIERRGEEVL